MTIDKKLLNRKINLINKDLKQIKQISLLSFEDFLKKEEYEVLSERYLERIIGRMIDINYHVLLDLLGESPKNYFESFILMGKNNILPEELAKSLAQASGLRNKLAHEYDDIDESKIYNSLQTAIVEVPKYLQNILKIIEDKNKLF